jgi:hypothetical protein
VSGAVNVKNKDEILEMLLLLKATQGGGGFINILKGGEITPNKKAFISTITDKDKRENFIKYLELIIFKKNIEQQKKKKKKIQKKRKKTKTILAR